jgi:signal transduction histidine kinase
VENAVRHTGSGGVVVATRRNAGYPAGVWLEVRDTGSGIAPKHLPRIFQRFYRPDPGRSRAEGGTGLGLAIVKHLAEAHGGEVRAESAVGVGTTIEVWLPAPGTREADGGVGELDGETVRDLAVTAAVTEPLPFRRGTTTGG